MTISLLKKMCKDGIFTGRLKSKINSNFKKFKNTIANLVKGQAKFWFGSRHITQLYQLQMTIF